MGGEENIDGRALSARSISVSFGGLRVLHGVSIDVQHGSITGLIGPNGAGKTTLINVMSGFQRPDPGGEVLLDTIPLTGLPTHRVAASGLARTFQGGRLFARMTVFENVYVAALTSGATRTVALQRSRDLLEEFGLAHRAASFAGDMPYGEERLLSIARSLATSPRYLLLDEPAAGLNEPETRALAATLRRIPEQFGCGVMIVEHDMDLIMGICAHVWVLAHGANLADGAPDEIARNPAVIREYLGGLDDAA